MKICQYCSAEYSDNGIRYHERYCKKNPNRDKHKPKTKTWYDSQRTKISHNQYTKAKQNGTAYTLSKESRKKMSKSSSGRKHSEETKKRLSEWRIKFLQDNPEMVPYRLNHYSKGPSYPEIYFKGILDSHNVDYVEQYPFGRYQLDFAIMDRKIDFEVDGDQHYLDPRIVESDKRRNKHLIDSGWRVIRIRWSDYKKLEKKDRERAISKLLDQLT